MVNTMKTSSSKHLLTRVVFFAALLLVHSAGASREGQRLSSRTEAADSGSAFRLPQATLPASTSPPTGGRRGYRRFHANNSFIGKPIPCTYEEKICFRYNTLYSPRDDRCLPVPDDECEFLGDRHGFLRGSGHLFAVCPGYLDPCSTRKIGYRMAYDGRCYPKQIVRDVICGCDAEPTPHFLGGVECRCTPPTRIHVEQPQEEGRCRIPDLRFPDHERSFLYGDPESLPNLNVNCPADQAACFSKGKVRVRGTRRRCYNIHERGPCRKNYMVALDREAALSLRAEATCVHVRGGCPVGQKRMAFDGLCHKDRDIHLLTFGTVQSLVDGTHIVNHFASTKTYEIHSRPVPGTENVQECILEHSTKGQRGPRVYPVPPCAADRKGLCHLYDVEAEAPVPELDYDE